MFDELIPKNRIRISKTVWISSLNCFNKRSKGMTEKIYSLYISIYLVSLVYITLFFGVSLSTGVLNYLSFFCFVQCLTHDIKSKNYAPPSSSPLLPKNPGKPWLRNVDSFSAMEHKHIALLQQEEME